MASELETSLRAQLRSSDEDEIYSALIDIGREGLVEMRADVERFLGHDEPELRSAAIRVLGFYWELDGHRQTADRMWRTDPDDEVRAVALMAWGKYYAGSRDPSVLRTLLGLLNDVGAIEDVRAQAWPSLLSVAAVPKEKWPRDLAVYGRIDEAVDWPLVYEIEDSLP